METKLKVFDARYYRRWGMGTYDEIMLVVVAENKDVALGLALESHVETDAKFWDINEIDITHTGTHFIDSRTA